MMLIPEWLYTVVDGRRLCGTCLREGELRATGAPIGGECDRCKRWCP